MRPTNILRDQSSILQFVIDKEKKDMNQDKSKQDVRKVHEVTFHSG